MPEGEPARAILEQEPGRQRLGERIAMHARHALDIEALSDHRCGLERVARVQREGLGAQQDGIEHALGQRQPARLGAAPVERERGRELLDVERDALRTLVHGVDERIVELVAAHERCEPRGVLAVEGLQRQLHRLADAAQLGAQAPEPVHVRGHLVAHHHDQQERRVTQPRGEPGHQHERRLVRPLEVVEHDRDLAARADLGERFEQGLDERRLPRVVRRVTDLGQQGREVRRAGGRTPRAGRASGADTGAAPARARRRAR